MEWRHDQHAEAAEAHEREMQYQEQFAEQGQRLWDSVFVDTTPPLGVYSDYSPRTALVKLCLCRAPVVFAGAFGETLPFVLQPYCPPPPRGML